MSLQLYFDDNDDNDNDDDDDFVEEYEADKKGDTCCVTAAFLMLRHEL